ncbi:hypothetical protein [Flavobacterium sp. JAS]|uniref:hypothetical protein n=1 Tax=Flavobacterium sp. JAS TaxID=2897329 RepID=UPI001E4F0719|nr:hypothetical protein [Flavobacterium sp. JAS]MCD0472506.1 hypothetical protein [Flavobacterium sp. JAS]
MSKKLRFQEPIKIAPNIIGWLDENYAPIIIDERTNEHLDPTNLDHKIIIYEQQVREWFLNPAAALIPIENRGFIVLMICLSYLEGVEQYRRGESSKNKSKEFFISALKKMYPNEFSDGELKTLYDEARNGLFHNGMVKGKIIINYEFEESIRFQGTMDIRINPRKLFEDIENDFTNLLAELKVEGVIRNQFDQMYSNI